MKRGLKEKLDLFAKAAKAWSADSAPSMGAALAFYTLFSLAPTLVLAITIAGFVIGQDQAQQLLMSQLSGLLGDTGAQGVKSLLDATSTHKDGLIATTVSIVTLALGATTVFAELQNDLDRIWHYEAPKASGLWALARGRFLSFGMVLAIGFLLVVSLVVSAALSYIGQLFGGFEAIMHGVDLIVSVAIMTGLFALMFKYLPSAHTRWRYVWPGAFVTAVLFAVGKFAIGLYLGRSSYASSFGAAGTLVVAIMWVYYSAQIFFYGGEFTRAFAERAGEPRGTLAAANSEFVREDDAMVDRARRIVRGKDPAVSRGPAP